MTYKVNISIRKKLILMFLSTTVVAHLVVGAIGLNIIKSYFNDLGYQHISDTFDRINHESLIDSYNSVAIKGFENAKLKIWNIKNGSINYRNSDTKLLPEALNLSLKQKGDKGVHRWDNGKDHYLATSFYIDDRNTMVVGMNFNQHIAFFETCASMILWFTLAMSLLAILYSFVIVDNGLRPLKQFETYLSQIRPGNLGLRIPVEELPFELAKLGRVQNAMIDRLDEGFKRLSDFSSDIAHELRTPLTNMTTQTQVILSADRELAVYHDTLGSNLEELERINKTINDTLYLAKADNELLYKNDQQLDLKQEIAQLVEYHNVVAEDKGLTITLEGEGSYFCDKLMLQRAINNLLSNAMRHASPHTNVSIIIKQSDEALTIAVLNTGDTIPSATLPLIFDRFYRSDKSREFDGGFGAGLGLAITKSIVESFGGTITAESLYGKTKFEIKVLSAPINNI